eukprot:s57_g31.t2
MNVQLDVHHGNMLDMGVRSVVLCDGVRPVFWPVACRNFFLTLQQRTEGKDNTMCPKNGRWKLCAGEIPKQLSIPDPEAGDGEQPQVRRVPQFRWLSTLQILHKQNKRWKRSIPEEVVENSDTGDVVETPGAEFFRYCKAWSMKNLEDLQLLCHRLLADFRCDQTQFDGALDGSNLTARHGHCHHKLGKRSQLGEQKRPDFVPVQHDAIWAVQRRSYSEPKRTMAYLTYVLNETKQVFEESNPPNLRSEHLFKLNEAVFNLSEVDAVDGHLAVKLFQAVEKIHTA